MTYQKKKKKIRILERTKKAILLQAFLKVCCDNDINESNTQFLFDCGFGGVERKRLVAVLIVLKIDLLLLINLGEDYIYSLFWQNV